MNLIWKWILGAAALFVVAYFVPGVTVSGIPSALIAAAVIGLINATLGAIIKFLAFPLRVLTLGLFSLVINALMLWLAAALVPGFHVSGFVAAFVGSIVLSLVTMAGNWLLSDSDEKKS
jgi:putative membrane protein